MTHSANPKVALFGASGKLGQPLLSVLLKEDFEITVIARASSKFEYPASVKVKQVSDSYEKSEVVKALKGQDAAIIAFSFFGNASHHRTVIDAAAEAGVKHLIPNHWGSNAENTLLQASSARSKALDEDVDYLRSRESTISWTAIIPGIFFDLAFPYGLLGFNLRDKSVEIWDSGEATFSASTNEDIANATIAVLRQPQLVKNQYVYTSSFSTSQNQLLKVVETTSGQQWTIKKVKSEDKVRQAKETIASGAQGMQWLMAEGTLAASSLFGGEEYQADFERSGRSSNAVLGLKSRSVEDSVKKFMS